MSFNSTNQKSSGFTYLAIFAVSFFLLFLFSLWNILFPFSLGVILAFLIDPLIVQIEKLKVPRYTSIFLCFIILLFSSIFIIGFLLPSAISSIVTSLTELVIRLQANEELVHSISLYFQKYNIHVTSKELIDFLLSKINPIIGNAVNYSFSLVKWIFQGMKIWVLSAITLIYILIDKKSILNSLESLIPQQQKNIVLAMYTNIIKQIYKFILSLAIVSVIVFIVMFIVLQFFNDSPSPFMLALGSGVLSMIPFLGGILPPIFVFIVHLIYNTSIDTITWVLTVEVLFYGFIGIYLQPFMTGKTVKIHPLIILICIIIGGSIDGVFGVLISIPIYIILRTIFTYFFNKYKKEEGLLNDN